MSFARREGFVLPFAFLLALAMMAVAWLLAGSSLLRLQRDQHELHRRQASNALRENLPALVEQLKSLLLDDTGATALQPFPGTSKGALQPVFVREDNGTRLPLHSGNGSGLCFVSPIGAPRLGADFILLSPGVDFPLLELAWAAEDLTLHTADPVAGRPAFWPLPQWNLGPAPPLSPLQDFLDRETHGRWRAGGWLAIGEELEFVMAASPEHVPVVREVGLRFGIFASGPERSREKVVRMRYYLEGTIWNPYNRQMRFHYGGGDRPAFQVVFWNLPEVRIQNLDRGMSTNWISLDEAVNASSGKSGIGGWVRMPGRLEGGTNFAFHEPDQRRQPEGLARTLHPGFPAGPADRIEVEFREPAGGLQISFLPLEESDPLTAAMNGEGWFRVSGYPVTLSRRVHARADEGPAPFYLAGGSLAFRIGDAAYRIGAGWRRDALEGALDPRRRDIDHGGGVEGPGGGWMRDANHFLVTARIDPKATKPLPAASLEALFSWPDTPPGNLLTASDLVDWSNGFRLGTAGASRLNQLLNEDWAWPHHAPEEEQRLMARDGQVHVYRPVFPINTIADTQWRMVLEASAETAEGPRLAYPAYAHPDPAKSFDYRSWAAAEPGLAAAKLAAKALHQPSNSVGDFFDRGLLGEAFAGGEDHAPDLLMPLRGWMRHSPAPRAHGSAWVLHLAVRLRYNETEILRSARVWLLETGGATDGRSLEIIQFQWTNPAEHLQLPPG